MKNVNIFLDDERDPIFVSDIFPFQEWVVLRNYDEFCQFVDSNLERIGLISFDHDIASYDSDGFEKTGKDAASYLCGLCMDRSLELPDVFVHSQNPVGKSNILSYFLSYLNSVENKNLYPLPNTSGYVGGKLV